MNKSEQTFRSLLIVFLLTGCVTLIGGFLIGKKSIDIPQVSTQNSTEVVVSGFERDLNMVIPTSLPKNLITEKNITPIESFSVKTDTETQYTYTYITNLSSKENYDHFFNFLSQDGGKIISNISLGSGWIIHYTKGESMFSLTYSVNTQTHIPTMHITLSEKHN